MTRRMDGTSSWMVMTGEVEQFVMILDSESNSSRKGLVKVGDVALLYINQRKIQAIIRQNPMIIEALLLSSVGMIITGGELDKN